jgi:hypothetical protein
MFSAINFFVRFPSHGRKFNSLSANSEEPCAHVAKHLSSFKF